MTRTVGTKGSFARRGADASSDTATDVGDSLTAATAVVVISLPFGSAYPGAAVLGGRPQNRSPDYEQKPASRNAEGFKGRRPKPTQAAGTMGHPLPARVGARRRPSDAPAADIHFGLVPALLDLKVAFGSPFCGHAS